jgi:hypothetical protein
MNELPSRGEIWLADLNPIRGHEQAGTRPCPLDDLWGGDWCTPALASSVGQYASGLLITPSGGRASWPGRALTTSRSQLSG